MNKEEAPTTKPEAKGEGAPKPLHVEHSDKRKRNILTNFSTSKRKRFCYIALALGVVALLIGCVIGFSSGDRKDPRFTLDDLYLDPSTNSTFVKLSSFNPSSKTKISYRNMRVKVWIIGVFMTEKTILESTVQQPHEITRWTAAVATNNFTETRPGGSFQMRNGVADGKVIAEFSFVWKSGIFNIINRSMRVNCPVAINLKDLTSLVPRPMTRCSTVYTG